MSLGTTRPYLKTNRPTPVAGDVFVSDNPTTGIGVTDWADLLVALQSELGNNMTIEEVANAAARNALTVSAGEVGKRLVRLIDTGVIYLANAAGTGAGVWTVYTTTPAATSSTPGIVRLAASADSETDDSKALTIAEFLRRLGPYRNALAPAQSLSFGGTAGAPLSGVTSLGTSFTLAWVAKPNATSGIAGILAASGTNAGNLYTDNGIPVIYNGVTPGGFSAGVSGTAGVSDFWAYTLASGTGKWFKNGNLVATVTDPGTYTDAIIALGREIGNFYWSGTLRLVGILNFALTGTEVVTLCQTGAVASTDIYGTGVNTTITAGAFVAGKKYRIVSVGSTSFTGIGASANTAGVEFTATGTGTGTGTATALGALVAPDWAGYTGGPQVRDVSGPGADINLPGDGVTGGVVPTLPGATPSPFRATRTTSGYLIGDQVVIPPGCSVEIWAKGSGTFSLGDSSGTPASIISTQTAPTNLSPIAQAGYVTANRKLYLTLGTATSVTVLVKFNAS